MSSHARQQQAVLVLRLLKVALSPWPQWNRRAWILSSPFSSKRYIRFFKHKVWRMSLYSVDVIITFHLPNVCIISHHLLLYLSVLCLFSLFFLAVIQISLGCSHPLLPLFIVPVMFLGATWSTHSLPSTMFSGVFGGGIFLPLEN